MHRAVTYLPSSLPLLRCPGSPGFPCSPDHLRLTTFLLLTTFSCPCISTLGLLGRAMHSRSSVGTTPASKISHYFQPKRKASDEAASSCKAGGKRPCFPVHLHQPHGRAAATARGSQIVGPEAFASKPALSPEIDVGAVAAHYGLAALSPLERQVVALKAEVPGCLLLAEVGYKYCAFGEDAEVLSAVLHVSHFTKQHMLVAGFPTPRSRAIRLAAALVAKQPVVRLLSQLAQATLRALESPTCC